MLGDMIFQPLAFIRAEITHLAFEVFLALSFRFDYGSRNWFVGVDRLDFFHHVLLPDAVVELFHRFRIGNVLVFLVIVLKMSEHIFGGQDGERAQRTLVAVVLQVISVVLVHLYFLIANKVA